METPPLHPLLKVAAVSVIVASAVGVAAMTGVFSKISHTSEPMAVAASAPAVVTPAASAPVAVISPEKAPTREQTLERDRATFHPRPVRMAPAVVPPCYTCGRVVAVNVVEDPGQGTGLGAVGGAAAGGVLGHQMGSGRGKEAMTIAGALLGAFAGNEVEKKVRRTQHYEVVVQMEDGSTQTFNYQDAPPFNTGEAVNVSGAQLIPRG